MNEPFFLTATSLRFLSFFVVVVVPSCFSYCFLGVAFVVCSRSSIVLRLFVFRSCCPCVVVLMVSPFYVLAVLMYAHVVVL